MLRSDVASLPSITKSLFQDFSYMMFFEIKLDLILIINHIIELLHIEHLPLERLTAVFYYLNSVLSDGFSLLVNLNCLADSHASSSEISLNLI